MMVKKYDNRDNFQIPQALSELPANWPSQFSQSCVETPEFLNCDL